MSHNKAPIAIPPSFRSHLPSEASFEAVLWSGYNRFQNSWNAATNPSEENWKSVSLLAFDAPLMYTYKYEDRVKYLQSRIPVEIVALHLVDIRDDNTLVKVLAPRKLTKSHMMRMMLEGEGLLFRKPRSKYAEQGSFLKLLVRLVCQ